MGGVNVEINRRLTRRVMVGGVPVGGGAPVSVQSLCKCDTRDVVQVMREIQEAADAGADIMRVACPTDEAAEVFKEICTRSPLPVVADIHFHYKLALKVLEAGIAKLRINPGNIGERWKVEAVVKECKDRGVPIRIGVNAGSLEEEFLDRYGGYPTVQGMVDSALKHIGILEDLDFTEIIISMKASSVPMMIEAYREIARRVDYPLHLGVTEAGPVWAGSLKSAVGIGTCLAEGIGDTIRVSLAGPIKDEVQVGWQILKSLGLRSRGINIIACPSCGRVEVDIVKVAQEVERRLAHIETPLNVAVMGCRVNGPGEAAGADVALFGGKGAGMLYFEGQRERKVSEEEMVDELVAEVERKVAQIKAAEGGS